MTPGPPATAADTMWVTAATVAFLVLWTTVYGAASALSAYVPWQVHVALPFEPFLPLVPAAAVPYTSLAGLLLLVPLAGRTRANVLPVFRGLVAQTLVAAVCFVVLPVAREPWLDPPPTTAFMAMADAMNLDRNYLPSLHVSYATTAALALARRGRGWGAVGWTWALAITAATLLLRYHYVLDAAAGLALAAAADWWGHRRVRA